MWPEMSLVSEREGRKRLNNGVTSYRFVITSILFVILLLGIMGAQVPFVKAAELHVGRDRTYSTIQAAINNASDGDTIFVDPGTYNEVIIINKGVTIIGAGADTTIIRGAGKSGPVVTIDATKNVKFTGFTIRDAPKDAQGESFGMLVKQTTPTSGVTYEISYCKFVGTNNPNASGEFQFYASGGEEAILFHHNTVTQYSGNAILSEIHTGPMNVSYNTFDAPLTNVESADVIFFMTYGGKDVTTLQKIAYNTFNMATASMKSTAVTFAAPGPGGDQGNAKFTNILITENTFSNLKDDGRAIGFWNGHLGGTPPSIKQDNIISPVVTNNEIYGVPGSQRSYGISFYDNYGSTTGATITGNTITGVAVAIYLRAGDAPGTVINFNNIHDNAFGVDWTIGATSVNAKYNWWGSATGPTHSSNSGGTGDNVSGNVDFTPWLLAPTSGGMSGTVSGSGTVDAKTEADTTVDISATVSHTITVASYTSNPGGALPLTALGKYIDVHLDSSFGVTEIVIKVYYTDDEVAAAGLDENTLMLFWWNGASWVACSDQGRDTVNNYIWARITVTTTPSLSQLVGTPFGAGGRAPAPPPAAKYLRVELHPSSVEVDVSSGPRSIRVTADASTSDGASAYITYMWSVSGGELNVEQGRFVEASTVEWTLTGVGDYSITCVARSQGYNDGEAVASVTAIPEIGSPLGIFYVALTVVYILLWGVRWRRGETW